MPLLAWLGARLALELQRKLDMPLLGGLLVNLFSGLVAWLLQFVTRKVAFGLAAMTMLSALTMGLFVLMRATLSSLYASAHGASSLFIDAVGVVVPPVSTVCVSSYITVWTACTVYVWQRDLLHIAIRA